jgi:hypothetical protein
MFRSMSLFYHHALGYGFIRMQSLELKNSRQATISAIKASDWPGSPRCSGGPEHHHDHKSRRSTLMIVLEVLLKLHNI